MQKQSTHCLCGCGTPIQRGPNYRLTRYVLGHQNRTRAVRGPQPKPVEQRFWKYVEKTDTCWLWTGGTIRDHGATSVGNRKVYAHRVSWEMHRGPIPEGLLVCHNCPGGDNPRCVNPDHLFLGTIGDNYRDLLAKKGTPDRQYRRGEQWEHAKLTAQDVAAIKARHAAGASIAGLAREYGVSESAIRNPIRGKSWKHVA